MTLEQTIKKVQEYAEKNSPTVIFLHGNLGAGKTYFTNQFAQSIGYNRRLPSPTFTFLQEYRIDWENKKKIVHCDFYRIEQAEAEKTLEQIGFWDYLQPNNIIFIEWPEKTESEITEIPHMKLKIEINSDGTRSYDIS